MGVQLLKLETQKLALLIFSWDCSQSSKFIAKRLLIGYRIINNSSPWPCFSSHYSLQAVLTHEHRGVSDSAVVPRGFGARAHQGFCFQTKHRSPRGEAANFLAWEDCVCKNCPKEALPARCSRKAEQRRAGDYYRYTYGVFGSVHASKCCYSLSLGFVQSAELGADRHWRQNRHLPPLSSPLPGCAFQV